MKYMQLFSLIAVLVPLSLAASGASNSEFEKRNPLPAQADDAAAAVADNQQINTDCDNHLKIHRVHGNCDPAQSRGIRKSAHNCKTKQNGKYYYCFNTVTQTGTCIDISVAVKNGYEHGECFL